MLGGDFCFHILKASFVSQECWEILHKIVLPLKKRLAHMKKENNNLFSFEKKVLPRREHCMKSRIFGAKPRLAKECVA